MRTGRIRFFLAGKIPHDGVRDFATQPFGWKLNPLESGTAAMISIQPFSHRIRL